MTAADHGPREHGTVWILLRHAPWLDLAEGEADIALRSGDVDDEALVGRKIAGSVTAIPGTFFGPRSVPASLRCVPGWCRGTRWAGP